MAHYVFTQNVVDGGPIHVANPQFCCNVINCEMKFSSKKILDEHMTANLHTPCNLNKLLIDGGVQEKESLSHCCPDCSRILKTADACRDHIRCKHNVRKDPLPVAGYICPRCINLFPSLQACTVHIKEEKHSNGMLSFRDDPRHAVPLPIPYPAYQLLSDYCNSVPYCVDCIECEEILSTAMEIKQHASLKHRLAALADSTPALELSSLVQDFSGHLNCSQTSKEFLLNLSVYLEESCKVSGQLNLCSVQRGVSESSCFESFWEDLDDEVLCSASCLRGDDVPEEGKSLIPAWDDTADDVQELLTKIPNSQAPTENLPEALVIPKDIQDLNRSIEVIDDSYHTGEYSHNLPQITVTKTSTSLGVPRWGDFGDSIIIIDSDEEDNLDEREKHVKSLETHKNDAPVSLSVDSPKEDYLDVRETCVKFQGTDKSYAPIQKKNTKQEKLSQHIDSHKEDHFVTRAPCVKFQEMDTNDAHVGKKNIKQDKIKAEQKLSQCIADSLKKDHLDVRETCVKFQEKRDAPVLKKNTKQEKILQLIVDSLKEDRLDGRETCVKFQERDKSNAPDRKKNPRKEKLSQLMVDSDKKDRFDAREKYVKRLKTGKYDTPLFKKTKRHDDKCRIYVNSSLGRKKMRRDDKSGINVDLSKADNFDEADRAVKYVNNTATVSKSDRKNDQGKRLKTVPISERNRQPVHDTSRSVNGIKQNDPSKRYNRDDRSPIPADERHRTPVSQRPAGRNLGDPPRGSPESPEIPLTQGTIRRNEHIALLESLNTMRRVIFVDLDNWSKFFDKLSKPLPKKHFVWAFYGGSTRWIAPYRSEAYLEAVRSNCFKLNEKSGTRKDSADFAICYSVGQADMVLTKTISFIILSGDGGFQELEHISKNTGRKINVVNPHNRMPEEVYAELVAEKRRR